MAHSMDFLVKKLDKIKINDDVFLGNDLTFEQNFLNKLIEKIEEEIENQNVDGEVSYYLHQISMSICCETSIMTETLARKLLKLTNWLMDEHFFQNNGLRELGWCSHYMLDRRSYNYHENKRFFKKTEIVEFYWFNSSPSRFKEQKTISEVKACNCMHCQLIMS